MIINICTYKLKYWRSTSPFYPFRKTMSMSFICSTFNSPPPSPVLKFLHLVFQLGMKRFNQPPGGFQPTVFWNMKRFLPLPIASPKIQMASWWFRWSWKLPLKVGLEKSPSTVRTPPSLWNGACLCRPAQGWWGWDLLRGNSWVAADGFFWRFYQSRWFFCSIKKAKTSTMEIYQKFAGNFWYYHDMIPLSKCHPFCPFKKAPRHFHTTKLLRGPTLLAAREGSSLILRWCPGYVVQVNHMGVSLNGGKTPHFHTPSADHF